MYTYLKALKSVTLLILSVSLVLLSACSRCDSLDKKEVVAYVNREPIFESELRLDIALTAKQNPSFKLTREAENEVLNNIINRKLLIQEATKKGLEREPRFANTIKRFWEQTLIRDFVDYKEKEFQDYLYVTDDEVNNYYENLVKAGETQPVDSLRPEIRKRIADEKANKLFENWFKDERARAKIEVIKK